MFFLAKLKNKEIRELFDKEVKLTIEKDKKTVNIMINNPIDESHIKYYLDNIDKKLFIELDNNEKISLINFLYFTEVKENQMNISVKGQFLYIGNDFITEMPTSAKLINIIFGDEIILDINEKMRAIFKENCVFKINNCVIKISNQNITIENYNKETIDLFELYEVMWIVYGFFPPIKHIEYIDNEKKLTEYIDFVYNRVSNREHFLEMNKLVNIEKIDNLYEVIKKWRDIKNKYGETFINFLFYTTSNYAKYIDIQLCNVVQVLDGYTDIVYDFNESDEKNIIIDELITYLKNLNAGEFENGLEGALNSLRRKSLKSRINTFIEEYDKYDIFREEKILCSKFEKKENKCKIFIKYNKFLNEVVNQRNALSHIKDNSEWDFTKIRMYYWKLLLHIRISLNKQITSDNCIEIGNIEKQCKATYEWYLKYNNKCSNCPYNKNSICEIFNI